MSNSSVSRFSPRPRVLDIDGSLRRQREFIYESKAQVQPLESWGPRLRYLCRRQTRQRFERALNPLESKRLTFYGSGDFHHLTFSLLKSYREPMSVVVFDQHPDWDITSPFPCCGTWVNDALRLPHIERIIVIGAGEEDLGGAQLWRGNRAALESGRLEIYPATLRSSLWPGFKRELACGERERGHMKWRTVEQMGMDALVEDVMSRLKSKRLYISVDKDCLREQEARSNWNEGELELSVVCDAIEQLRQECELVGADVTGEWSAPRFRSSLVAALSRADHPVKPSPTSDELRVNERSNFALWRAFGGS